jgi:hypothetical protein
LKSEFERTWATPGAGSYLEPAFTMSEIELVRAPSSLPATLMPLASTVEKEAAAGVAYARAPEGATEARTA